MRPKAPTTTEAKEKISTAIPVKLDEAQMSDVNEMVKQTGISRSALLRMGFKWFLPKFRRGEITMKDLLSK